tara:strand:+ start:113 stop:463 length:351 start_codon:yes stop_codon:yes gene_type:complete
MTTRTRAFSYGSERRHERALSLYDDTGQPRTLDQMREAIAALFGWKRKAHVDVRWDLNGPAVKGGAFPLTGAIMAVYGGTIRSFGVETDPFTALVRLRDGHREVLCDDFEVETDED